MPNRLSECFVTTKIYRLGITSCISFDRVFEFSQLLHLLVIGSIIVEVWLLQLWSIQFLSYGLVVKVVLKASVHLEFVVPTAHVD